MTSLKQTIVDQFLADLAARKAIDQSKIEALRKLITEQSKVKPDDFVRVFTDDGDDVA
jgi:hypothetical protein